LKTSTLPINGNVESINGELNFNSPHVLQHNDRFVWGGSAIKGEDGKYYLFYSTWESGPDYPKFGDSWLLHSKIACAVSDYPDCDFQFVKFILKGRIFEGAPTAWDAVSVHNPHIRKFNNQYYLYFTGAKDPGTQPEGSPGAKLSKRNRIQQSQQLGVIEFNSVAELLAGNFKRPDKPLLSPRTRVKPDNILNPSPEGTKILPDNIIVVNPSVVYREYDKKYMLFFKGNIWDPNWRGVHGVALSDSPTGPFKALDRFVFDIRTTDGKIANAEDPYVWFHKKHNCFYAIYKDFSGIVTGGEPGLAIIRSKDGLEWETIEGGLSIKKEIKLINGETYKVAHLERPQFLIDDNGLPKVLYAACSFKGASGLKDGSTFNIQIPLKSE
jgi:hypothetical protein